MAVRLWGLSGALVGVCINQALLVVATIILCKRLPWLRIKNFFGSIDFQIARELGAFALMAATSAAVAPHILQWETLPTIQRNHSQGNGLGGISGERRPC